jgi:hypothetical protein
LTQQEPHKLLGDTLLDDLKDTPTSQIGDASKRANHFSAEDEDHDKRLGRAERRRAFRKIQLVFYWFLLALGCACAFILAIGFLMLIGIYLMHIIWGYRVSDPGALLQAITGVLWTIVVAMATLWTEGALKEADR